MNENQLRVVQDLHLHVSRAEGVGGRVGGRKCWAKGSEPQEAWKPHEHRAMFRATCCPVPVHCGASRAGPVGLCEPPVCARVIGTTNGKTRFPSCDNALAVCSVYVMLKEALLR